MRPLRPALLALTLTLPSLAPAQDITWARDLYDPGAARDGSPEPDLVLPMPCGGAMAFQRVTVSLDAADPLADVRIRLGQTGGATGYSDFLRYGYIRGGFDEAGGAASYYYMSRYELTEGQYKALTEGEACGSRPSRKDTVAKGGLSWFDAVDLSRTYTEWLNTQAPDQLPKRDQVPGYLRLPTETEWDFATRGGEAVTSADFAANRFPMDDSVSVYARFDKENMGPVGVSKPNPLGFYDLYGNAEEIVLDPFQMNAVGHSHGQPGGMITRGASYLASEAEMRSAWRREWGLYGRDGRAQAQPTFGMRFVISAPIETSDSRLNRIRDAFQSRLGSEQADSPTADLAQMARDELDPARKAALEGLQLALETARDQADTAKARQLETTLLASAIFLTSIWDDTDELSDLIAFRKVYETQAAQETDVGKLTELQSYVTRFDQRVAGVTEDRDVSIAGYRDMLTYLTEDVPPDPLTTARVVLGRKLQEAGNTELSAALAAVSGDIETYRPRPDMSPETFLAMITEP